MMSKFIIIIICLMSINLNAQTLMTLGKSNVTKKEFLKAFNKNNSDVKDKKKAYQEYLDLYTKFKLKVNAARELGLDTIENIKTETQNFRNQIIDNYITDEKIEESMINEAYERSKVDKKIIVYHIPLSGEKVETSKIKLAVNETFKIAKTNSLFNEDIANQITNKYSKVFIYNIGYINAFSVPYEFETIAYNLKKGEISNPIILKKGYYMVKVIDERKAVGRWKVAQILLTSVPGQSNDLAVQTSKLIIEKLKSGESFESLAKTYSNDKTSNYMGGELPEFGVGKYDESFENKVFQIKTDGEIADPFSTSIGLHIVKKITSKEVPNNIFDDGYYNFLRQKLQQDSRFGLIKSVFAKKIIQQLGFKSFNVDYKKINEFGYEALNAQNLETFPKFENSATKLFSIGNAIVTAKDFMFYTYNSKLVPNYTPEQPDIIYKKYIDIVAVEQYKLSLEKFNDDFKYQMQEFIEGNILFEIMEKNVWNKASVDTNGLKKLYQNQKNKYVWGKSADVIIVTANSKTEADSAYLKITNNKSATKLMNESNGNIVIDSNRYEIEQIPIPDNTTISEGMITKPQINTNDNTAYFIKVLKIYNSGETRNFDDAKGMLINDYQTILENNWLNELKNKYPVKINNIVWSEILNMK